MYELKVIEYLEKKCSGRQNVYYKYQYSKTYTLHSGLNRLQLYVTEIKETQIFEFLLFLSHT